jgi:HK97 family phage portal protein
MAWNRPQTKSLGNQQEKAIGFGAPISLNPGTAGRPYMDGWDVRRAYEEGVKRVVWVFRAIDVIASNQAKLPVVLRRNNDPNGELYKGQHDLLDIMNTKANIGEDSFVFRHRVSSQLLISSRGVFIEKIRARSGRLLALNILPPEYTAPIPDPKTFVSGFEVWCPGTERQVLRPEDVIWIRRPHPLDPYRSLTPMESAGIAIDIENLAKLYNRNFLLNDGRPGMLLVARGEVDEDDRHELEARFRGGPGRAGNTTVIGIEQGMDVVDLSANMRDAAYIQMRDITKAEILAAFGVPEPLIGNAADRTFSNAGEEIRVFWLETMEPHLVLLSKAFDALDNKLYVDFNTDEVPIMVLIKQERARFHLEELAAGTISPNEYREKTERKTVDSELADSLLMNPNLTPIANTKKKFEPDAQTPIDTPPGAPTVPGGPPGAPGAPQGAETPAEPRSDIEAALAKVPMERKSIGFTEGTLAAKSGVPDWMEKLEAELSNPNSQFVRVSTKPKDVH